jgi:2-succinyl-5-enolpyruvyl-6-hydroxy-3-cyclohexene-1-carboxylate synthase
MGIEHAVICPGSRSAPLVFAFTQNHKIQCHSAIDERSAAFMALGMAQQLMKPVVLISTSGTACLNFFPAVAEAYYQKIPLLILSADRPPELLNQQDGQMIMQKGVFGKHVLGSHELLCFEEDKIDYKLTERIVRNAIEETSSSSGVGPVHINVPLREPLYNLPENVAMPRLTINIEPKLEDAATPLPFLDILSKVWPTCQKKLILVGQMAPSKEISKFLNSYMNLDDVVVLTDIVSNQHEVGNIPYFDSLIQFGSNQDLESLQPDLILSFGGQFVSKVLKNWLKKQKPSYHFRLQTEADLVDTYLNVTHFIHAEVIPYLDAFHSLRIFKNPIHKPYLEEWKFVQTKAKNALTTYCQKEIWSEPIAVKKVLNYIPENSQLQLANSSIVRWVSWMSAPKKALHIFGNRGTSGIDGSISTAVGAAKIQLHKTITLLTGDLSLFYDQHGFWQNKLPINLRVIVFNNGQGNIFNWIDGPSQHPEQLEFFTTPTNLSVQTLAQQYGLKYLHGNNLADLPHLMHTLYQESKVPVILELKFEDEMNLQGISEFRNLKL